MESPNRRHATTSNYTPYSMSGRSPSNSSVAEPAADHLAARQIITDLRRKTRQQCEQIMGLQRMLQAQQQNSRIESHMKTEQLAQLATQLMLLESRLKRRQRQIANIMRQREATIARQQKTIDALVHRLQDHGIPHNVIMDINNGDTAAFMTDLDSLNDSDSAVVLDEVDLDWSLNGGNRRDSSADVTIVRSISDAIETSYKGYGTKRGSCFLRRPEVLETVYSVEEDHDPDAVVVIGDEKRESIDTIRSDPGIELGSARGSLTEDSSVSPERTKSPSITTHYNRVMSSNHRSVTKPKDVKYRRINKVKSKSLEELCGQLKYGGEGIAAKSSGGDQRLVPVKKLQHQSSVAVLPPQQRLPNQT